MAMVEVFREKNPRITFHDDYYKDRTPEQTKRILDNVYRINLRMGKDIELKRRQREAQEKAENGTV